MKKIFSIVLLLAVFGGQAQFSGTRYGIVPEGGGSYQVPNKEIKAIAYASTVTIATTHEETILQFATLSGAITVNANVTNCYKGDKLYCQFNANGSNRIITFGTGFSANGTLTCVASSPAAAVFMFNGTNWFEITRQNLNGSATTLLAGAGSAAAPSISFSAQNDLGLYKVSSSSTGFASGGTEVGGFNSAGLFTNAITEQTTGSGITLSKAVIKQNTATTYTATGTFTVTAAQLAGGLLVAATSTATTTMVLPTTAQMATQFGGVAGTVFDFYLLNNGASNGVVTISASTGTTASGFPGTNTLTLAGSATVGIAGFRITFLSATATTLTRIN